KEWRQKLGVTIASLRAQVHAQWRLLIVPSGPQSSGPIRDCLGAIADEFADRVQVMDELTSRALTTIAANCLGSAETFFTVLSPGDELGCDALLEMAIAAATHGDADFLYSDERYVNPATGNVEAFFKPQWSPD